MLFPDGYILLFIIAVLAAGAFWYCLSLWHSHIGKYPSRWPANPARSTLIKLSKIYLVSAGWSLFDPPQASDAVGTLRASNGKIQLKLAVLSPRGERLKLFLADKVGHREKDPTALGVLTRETIPENLRADAVGSGIFTITPKELPSIEDAIRNAGKARRTARITALKLAREAVINTEALSQDGTTDSIEGEYMQPGPANTTIQGFVESLNESHVGGWAFSPETPDAHVQIEVWDGGVLLAQSQANKARESLRRVTGTGDHGFSIHFADATPAAPANSKIEVKAILGDQSVKLRFLPQAKQEHAAAMGRVAKRAASQLIGFVEHVTPTAVRGWAFRKDAPDEHVQIEVWDSAKLLATGRADMKRPDLERAGHGNGDHAFVAKLNDPSNVVPPNDFMVFAISATGDRVRLRVRAGAHGKA